MGCPPILYDQGMAHDPVYELRRAVSAAGRHHQPGDLILIGVSGGADSLALAAIAARDTESGLRFGAVVVDHMLQPGSDAVAANAAQQCRELGLDPVLETHVHVSTGPGSGGLEQAARIARRTALLNAAEDYDAAAIWLAHTADDQAETVFLGLLRGSGPRSMAGMRDRDGIWERPLLKLDRATVRAALTQLGITAFEDPHNEDRRFTRVKIRHDILPLLERELGEHIPEQLVRSAELFRDDTDALDAMAEEWYATHEPLPIFGLQELPRALRTRVIRLAILDRGAPPNGLAKDHIDAVEHLVMEPNTTGPVRLPGLFQVNKDRAAGVITFQPTE